MGLAQVIPNVWPGRKNHPRDAQSCPLLLKYILPPPDLWHVLLGKILKVFSKQQSQSFWLSSSLE